MRQAEPHERFKNVFCSACIEIRRVPIAERYCPTCGTEFSNRPARQESSVQRAVASLASIADRLGTQAGATAPRGTAEDLESPNVREETMLMLLDRLQGMLTGAGDGTEDLGGLFGGGMGGAQAKGTPASVVDRLPRQVLHKTSSALLSVNITATAPGTTTPLRMDSVLADFSPVPSDGLVLPLALADPLTAHEPLKGSAEGFTGRAVLAKRGVASFASIALRAEAAGAMGTIVSNHVDVWPYTMKDSKGEIAAAGGLKGFVAMVPRSSGEALVELARGGGPVQLSFSISALEEECIICQELYQEGAELIKLPCNHLFHEDCCKKWLRLQHTCPTCRHPLPVSQDAPILGPSAEREREQATLQRMFS